MGVVTLADSLVLSDITSPTLLMLNINSNSNNYAYNYYEVQLEGDSVIQYQ